MLSSIEEHIDLLAVYTPICCVFYDYGFFGMRLV